MVFVVSSLLLLLLLLYWLVTATAIDGSVQRIDNMMEVERQQFEPVKRTDFSFESFFLGISILHKNFFSSVEIEKVCERVFGHKRNATR